MCVRPVGAVSSDWGNDWDTRTGPIPVLTVSSAGEEKKPFNDYSHKSGPNRQAPTPSAVPVRRGPRRQADHPDHHPAHVRRSTPVLTFFFRDRISRPPFPAFGRITAPAFPCGPPRLVRLVPAPIRELG